MGSELDPLCWYAQGLDESTPVPVFVRHQRANAALTGFIKGRYALSSDGTDTDIAIGELAGELAAELAVWVDAGAPTRGGMSTAGAVEDIIRRRLRVE